MGEKDTTSSQVAFLARTASWIGMSGLRTLGRTAFRAFACACVCLAWTLIIGISTVYGRVILPMLVDVRSIPGISLFIFASWISFNLIFNYAMVLWTNPGRPVGQLTTEEMQDMEKEMAPQKGKGWAKFCRHCKVPKPPRTHHCSICNRCVLKMDHHCPWINGCVGHRNLRYFALFIAWLAIACLYACITVILHWLGLLNGGVVHEDAFISLLFTFAICAIVMFAMTLFFSWNMYLVVTNQTTIEYHYNQEMRDSMKRRGETFMNPYDLGLWPNIVQVFGPCKSYWAILLPSWLPLDDDGVNFPTIHDPCPNV